MTETRKAIIELIEPYMDKTLTEECLLQFKVDNDIFIEKIATEILGYFYLGAHLQTKHTQKELLNKNIFKNIGHYDITALFKFLYINEYEVSIINSRIYIYKKDETCGACGEYKKGESFEINNKPLHLYTEEEDKELLEILTEIQGEYL